MKLFNIKQKQYKILIGVSLLFLFTVGAFRLNANNASPEEKQSQELALEQDVETPEVPELISKRNYELVVGEAAFIEMGEDNLIPLTALEFLTQTPNIVVITPSTGEILGVSKGATKVDVVMRGSSDVLDSFQVNVKDLEGSISFKEKNQTLSRGDVETLKPEVSESLSNRTLVWNSSDSTVIEVDQKGNIKAVGLGKAQISVQVEKFHAKIDISVEAPLEKINFNGNEIRLEINTLTDLPSLIYVPYDTTSKKEASYSSSDESVFIIEDNRIKGVGVGEAELIATIGDLDTEMTIVVTPIKNASGSEVLILNQFDTQPGTVIYKIEDLSLFVSDHIALSFNEDKLKDALIDDNVSMIRVQLSKRLLEKDMAVMSSFIVSPKVFEHLGDKQLTIQLENLKGEPVASYRFEQSLNQGIDLKFTLREVQPEQALYSKIQTKAYELQFNTLPQGINFEMTLPGERISTSPGQLHFLYTVEDDKIKDTGQQFLSEQSNLISFRVSSNHQIITFNKISFLTNKGLILTLGAIVLTIIGFAIAKGIKTYKKR